MIKKFSNIFFSILMGIVIPVCMLNAQSAQFQPDKPGKFVHQNQINKCPGLDEATLSKKLITIADWIHLNNAVVQSPVGNDTKVSFSGNLCDKRTNYEDFGIQCSIYFAFHDFYIENGVSHTATGNTAHGTRIHINNPITLISSQFTESGFKSGDPLQLKQPMEKALENLEQYYSIAQVLKDISPGVRLYVGGIWFTGVLLIYNPDRPDIWNPVTVREIMEAKLAYYKIKQQIDSVNYEKTLAEWARLNFKPNQIMRPNQYDLMKKEFENFTAGELSLPAWSSVQSGFSNVNARGEGKQVVRFNSACWDRSLPVTSVQFMSFEYRPATKAQLEEFKNSNQGLIDYVGLFFNNLPVEKMGVLIQKK